MRWAGLWWFYECFAKRKDFVVTISSVTKFICNFGQQTLPARKHSPSLWLSYWSHNSTYSTSPWLWDNREYLWGRIHLRSLCTATLHLTYLKGCWTWNECHCRNESFCTVTIRDARVTHCCGLGMKLPNLVLSLRLSIPSVTYMIPFSPLPAARVGWRRELEAQKEKVMD